MGLENQNNFDDNINNGEENMKLNEINGTEYNEKSTWTNKSEILNKTINPQLEKIKKLKENLRTKIGLENTLGRSLKDNFDEEKYLSKFTSGAVEFGLPCEVVYKRGMEVINYFMFYYLFLYRMN